MYRRTLSTFVLCLIILFGTTLLFGQTGIKTIAGQKSLKNLRLRSGKNFMFRVNKENSTVSFLKGALYGQLEKNVERSALQVLEAQADILGIKKPSEEFVLWNSMQDKLGMTHVRLTQRYRGIPVFGREIVVHFNSDGSARSINGSYFPTPEIEITPSLSSDQAIEIATSKLSTPPILRTPITTELNIYGKGKEAYLVWKVVIPARHPLGNWTYFIDANSGEVRNYFNDMKTDGPAVGSGPGLDGTEKPVHSYLEGSNYWMIDTSLPMFNGTYNRDNTEGAIIGYNAFSIPLDDPRWDFALIRDPNNDNHWDDYPGLRSAVNAQNYFRQTLEFYRNEYGRNSWNDQGGAILFLVHYGENMINAAWLGGGFMIFGDGDGLIASDFAGSLDVIAHEFTHGVTDATARLVYWNQSGALNESISDIFSSVVDDDDWLIGEDIWTPTVPGDALRSMEDPTLFGDPGHMDDYNFFGPEIDNGGVHSNSGIPNKAFYNIATSIGRKTAGQIFYRALTFYFTPLTQFVDARITCLAAADDLFGMGSPEYTAVQNGFDAVGILDGPPSLTPVVLDFGVAVNDAVGLQEYDLFYVDMPENMASLRVATTGTFGDVLDLFISHESIPTPEMADYFSATYYGNETIEITAMSYPPIASGRYYILVAAWDGGSYTITADTTNPQIVYVDKNATGLNDGSSWADADTSIQKGLDDADAQNKWVWVRADTFQENINMRRGVALFGGFDGTETELNQRDPATNQTIINGQNSGHVVNGIDDCRIDGFIIENGNSSSGGGVYSSYDNNFLITNNVIRNNSASIGGGIYASGSYDQAIIVGNVLYGNTATSSGAGIYFSITQSFVNMNTVVGNNGDGIYVNRGTYTIRYPFIFSNIIRGNTTQVGGFAFVDYSDVQGGYPGTGNIDADPLFVNAAANDYHLTANSPCIDAGHPLLLDPDGTRQDMGAFYFHQTFIGPEITINKSELNFGPVFLGEHVMRVLHIENKGISDLNITSITTDNTAYTLSEASWTLGAGEARNLFVTYTPATASTENATLTLNSNDSDEGTLNVALKGSGSTAPPEMEITSQALSAVVGPEGSATKFIVVKNNGTSDLNYQTKVSSGSFTTETFGAQENTFTGSNRMRGNIFHTDVATELTEIEMFLGNTSSTTVLEFVVYQGEEFSGPMVRIFSKTIISPGTGTKFYSSGNISVQLLENKYYFIGAAWNNYLTYYLADAVPPITTSFGTLEFGSEETPFFPSFLIYDPNDFFLHSPYYQRITTGGSGWASASPGNGTIASGSQASIQVNLDAAGLPEGEYYAGLTITSNDPDRTMQHIPINLRVFEGGVIPPRHFSFTSNTGEFYNIIIDDASIGGNPLEFGDEIAVLTPTGLVVGAVVWTETVPTAISAWRDDSQTSEVDGYIPGEAMSYRIWDKSTNAEGSAEPTYIIGDETFGFGIYSQLSSLIGLETLITVLPSNWCWISWPMTPSDLDAAAATSSISTLNIMVNNAGQFYIPGTINGIGNINIHEGYKVHLSDADDWVSEGTDISDDEPIILGSGWNFAAYFPRRSINAETALALIIDNLNIAQADEGGILVPGVINTIGNLEPFEGYRVHLSSSDTLTYPTSAISLPKMQASTPVVEMKTPRFYKVAHGGGEFHAVIIDQISIHSFKLSPEDEIGLFTVDGVCVGAALVQTDGPTPIAVWIDDSNTPTHDGYRSGEELRYRLFHAETKSEHVLESNWNGNLGELPFVQMQLSEFNLPTTYELFRNYPNPFNPETTIRFALPKTGRVRLAIYNILGQRVRLLVDDSKPAGFHKVVWDGRNEANRIVPSGVYFYRLDAEKFSATMKMTLLK